MHTSDPLTDIVQPRLSLPLRKITARPNYHWFVVGTVCIGAFMAALDGSIITVALPSIGRQFHVSFSATAWVALSYLLTLTALLAVFGRIADIVGRRPLYTIGFSVFIVGSAICGASPNITVLILARILQAIGAVMLQANSVAIITAAVPSKVRGKAIGIQGSALAVGLSLGPAIGGLLIAGFGWRAIFYVNVPVGIIGTTMAALILPKDQIKDEAAKEQHFDYLGALLLSIALVAVLLGLNQGNEKGWASLFILSCFFIFVVFVGAFLWQENRHKAPLIDLKLFKISQITWGNITGAISYALMYGVLFIIPYFYEDVLKKPSSVSGLLTTPLPIGMMLLAPIAGRIADRLGSKLPTIIGMALSTLGVIALTFITATTSFFYITFALLFIGIGMGIFTPPNNSTVMGSTPKNRLGVSSGVLNMARSLGQGFGIAYSFAIFQGVIQSFGYNSLHAPDATLLDGFHFTFIGVTILGIVAIAISLLRGNVEKAKG